MSAVVWVHWDAVSVDHPVMKAAPHEARRLFILDAQEIARRDWSLKRCVFLLECLEDMNLEIVEGQPSDILNSLKPSQVFTASSSDPYILKQVREIDGEVSVIQPKPFVALPDDVDMKRFFRYWTKAKKSVMQPTENRTRS